MYFLLRILSKHDLSDEDEKALSNPDQSNLQSYTSRVAAALYHNRDDLLRAFINKCGDNQHDLGKNIK